MEGSSTTVIKNQLAKVTFAMDTAAYGRYTGKKYNWQENFRRK